MEYPENLTQGFYRVIESEAEPSIILGAFRVLSNAKKHCDLYPGSYVVYDSGVKIYPEESGETDTPGGVIDPGDVGGEDNPSGEDTSGEAGGEAGGGDTGGEAGGEETGGEAGGGETGETGGENNPGEETGGAEGGETGEETGSGSGDETGGTTGDVVAYGKLKTVMHIRTSPSEDSDALAIYNAKAVVQITEFCENGWLKILCPESHTGIGYVSNVYDQYAYIGKSYYVVTIEGDRLEAIAERLLGDESRYTEIRTLNMLTSNQTYVGMELILPA